MSLQVVLQVGHWRGSGPGPGPGPGLGLGLGPGPGPGPGLGSGAVGRVSIQSQEQLSSIATSLTVSHIMGVGGAKENSKVLLSISKYCHYRVTTHRECMEGVYYLVDVENQVIFIKF